MRLHAQHSLFLSSAKHFANRSAWQGLRESTPEPGCSSRIAMTEELQLQMSSFRAPAKTTTFRRMISQHVELWKFRGSGRQCFYSTPRSWVMAKIMMASCMWSAEDEAVQLQMVRAASVACDALRHCTRRHDRVAVADEVSPGDSCGSATSLLLLVSFACG